MTSQMGDPQELPSQTSRDSLVAQSMKRATDVHPVRVWEESCSPDEVATPQPNTLGGPS